MKKIIFHESVSTPNLVYTADKEYDVEDAEANSAIKSGVASEVKKEEPKKAVEVKKPEVKEVY